MLVSSEDLAARLDRLRAECRDPRAGVFGPGSWMWQINKEAVAFVGGGCAALLQTAHPFVAHGVEDHSATKTDPLGRFVRTFDNVFALVFGDLEHALTSARRVHAYHRKVQGTIDEPAFSVPRGTRYAANDADALFWVAATLVDTSIRVYEPTVRRLTLWEKDAYYESSRRFCWLFGIPDRVMPEGWTAFERYMERMVSPGSVVSVGRAARDTAAYLLRPPRPALAPAWEWLRIMTAGLLPPRIRDEYRLHLSRADHATFRASLLGLKGAVRALPPSLRYLPGYNDALRRLGKDEGTTTAHAVQHAWTRLISAFGARRAA